MHAAQDGERWAIQLAAVACLSLAAKMEDGVLRLSLAELQARISYDSPGKILHVHQRHIA
jgi:hypothetical protein